MLEAALDILLLFSWLFMILGPLTGMYMATWAYGDDESSQKFGDYASPRRRMFRIAHINCFVFPYMGIMWALAVERVFLPVALVQSGAVLMMLATVFMTLPLFASLKWPSLRNSSFIGILALIGGISIISYGYIMKLLG